MSLPRMWFCCVEDRQKANRTHLVSSLNTAFDGTEVRQWAVLEEDRKRRRAMYREFLAYVYAHPEYTLCSWSGSNFDERAVEAGW
jgi:hypothetical protein